MTGINNKKDEFKIDVLAGLRKARKEINSKYFYDEKGCELFNQITRHPDYYLTNAELEILNTHKQEFSALLSNEPFNLVELGPGEGIKTQILMQQFLSDSLEFTYMPVDISVAYLNKLIYELSQELTEMNFSPIHSDYFNGLKSLNMKSTRRNLVLFLGSSIGNFDPIAIREFLYHLWETLNNGDYVLLGFDLRKDVDVLIRAYNDSDGITREFNLNILKRINRELGGNFNTDKFRHFPTYNVYSGAMESYLLSTETQVVSVEALQQSFSFQAIEPIHVECSYKYLASQIEELARSTGFTYLQNFTDSRQYFLDVLWQVKK